MSKHWTPKRKPVVLRPKGSRIRREPVRLSGSVAPEKPRTAVRTREQEMWGGVAGVALIAIALVAVIVGVSIATISRVDPVADARALQYDQCYNGGQNCVVDGNTIYVAGQKVAIAGVDAPRIEGAACSDERTRGIDAATRLAGFLNGGAVTLSEPFPEYGREVRAVEVKGRDVGQWMIGAGIARESLGQKSNWCSAAN